jgi:hypothetical protein
MGTKYSKFERKEVARPYKIHPIWRGIGFVMIILVPIMAGAAASELDKFARAQGWGLMYDMPITLQFPGIVYSLPYLGPLASYISSVQDLPAMLLFFLLFLMVFSGVLSFIYAAIYRLIGPPRYTVIDAPAPRVTAKKHTR